jgi:hypothetical protein
MTGILSGTRPVRARVMWWRAVRRWLVRGWLVLGLALFVYVLTRQPIGEIGAACSAMGPLALVAPAIAALWFATRTTTLDIVLGGSVPWRELFVTRFVGDGYNALLPLAGLGGEPFKLRRLGEYVAFDHALTGLVRDRMIDNAIGFVFSAACIALALPAFAVPVTGALWTYSLVASFVGAAMFLLVITRAPGRLGAAVGRRVAGTGNEAPRLPWPAVGRVVGWSLATRILQACETALLLHCVGFGFDPRLVLLVDGALNAAGFLGFMFPQGLGMVEGTAVVMLGALGATPAAATAFALTRRGRVVVVSLCGVLVHLWAMTGTVRRAS